MTTVSVSIRTLTGISIMGLVTACGVPKAERSAIKITNGRVVAEADYPSVVLLYDKTQGAICTGTFITPTVVLSAAHCTMGGKVDDAGVVDLQLDIIRITDPVAHKAERLGTSTAVVRNPLWDKNGKNVNKFDLSLITFPEGTAKGVTDIAAAGAKPQDAFTIVGYGLNQMTDASDGSSAGILREGKNTVRSVSAGFIQFNGVDSTSKADGIDASSASGDSGGPLFIKGRIAGVTSGGGWGGFGRTRSMYIDLWSSESQAFLSKHMKP